MSEQGNQPYIINTKSGRYIGFSGCDLITRQLQSTGTWEPHLTGALMDLLRADKGDFVDIGANMGAVSIPLALAFPDRRFYCFEAQRLVYQQLCGNAVLNACFNIYPYHLAIGAPTEEGEMIAVPVPDYATAHNIGGVSLDPRIAQVDGQGVEHVALLSLDSLGLRNISVIKIDVEGMELAVIKGMLGMLRDNDFPSILFETWRDEKYEWVEAERREICALLEEMGYRVDIFSRITTGVAQHTSRPYVPLKLEQIKTGVTIGAVAKRPAKTS